MTSLRSKAQLRRDEGTGGDIAGGLPLRRKQLLLSRAIGDTILPQQIWLEGGDSRLGLSAAWRRIYAITLTTPGAETVELSLLGLADADRDAVAGRLNACIRQFLGRDQDLKQSFTLLSDEFSPDDGLPAVIVLEPDQPAAVVDTAQETPAGSEPVPAATAEEPAAGPVQPVAEAVVPEPADAEAQEPQLMPIPRVTTPLAPTSMAEVVSNLQGILGPQLLMLWLPGDDPRPAEALNATDEGISLREFRSIELGLVIREWSAD